MKRFLNRMNFTDRLILCILGLMMMVGGAAFIRDCNRPAYGADIPHLFITDEIDADTVRAVGDLAEKLPTFIDVTIDSPGGQSDAAHTIAGLFRILQRNGTKIRCTVKGDAMSAAFWLLQVCTERVGTPKSRYMIHEPLVVIGPSMTPRAITLGTLRTITANLEKDLSEIVHTVAPRMQMPEEDFRKKIDDQEWRMTAQEALAAHAIDKIQ